jgi:tetratricopeptide (TPR) repeat protein
MQFKTRKAIFLLSISAALSFSAVAQSQEEGIKMVNYERYKSAQSTLGPLAASNPLANYYLGLAQLGAGDNAAALATFQKFPEDPANKAGMARIAFMNKDATRGMQLATEVANSAKKKEWQQLVWAADAINYGGGDAQAAINYYKEAIKRGGDNVGVRIGLGDAFLRVNGGGGEAMNNYENAVAKDAKNSLGYSRIGKLWYDARNFNDALTNWEKAKSADPNNPLPYRDLSDAYFRVNKYDLAKQNIEKYYELSDKDCDDRISYANILFLAKDYDSAIAKMQEVITTCGDKPYMYRVLGRAYYEQKQYDNALQNMRTFFIKQAAHPDRTGISPDDYLYMGRIFLAQKAADSADFYITKALAADTSSNKHQTYIDIAESYKSMATEAGYKKAAEYYQKASQSGDKANATDYFYSGYYFYRINNYKDAAAAFEQMETKYPDQPSATYWRARVAAAEDNEGKTGAAVPFFQKWLTTPETDRYKRKPEDLNVAYQYLAIVAYNKGDKAAMKENIEKIKAIDPNNALAKQLEGLMNKPATKAPASKPATTKPTTTKSTTTAKPKK